MVFVGIYLNFWKNSEYLKNSVYLPIFIFLNFWIFVDDFKIYFDNFWCLFLFPLKREFMSCSFNYITMLYHPSKNSGRLNFVRSRPKLLPLYLFLFNSFYLLFTYFLDQLFLFFNLNGKYWLPLKSSLITVNLKNRS